MTGDRMRTIERVTPLGDTRLQLHWSDGTEAEILLAPDLRARFGEAARFRAVAVGDWGHSLVWPDGAELGADMLWRETLTAIGRDDARQFLEWRLANGLSLAKSAEALGLSRRTIAYYSNGERTIPKAILLACKGWDALHGNREAA